jgi:hypothetical protein
MPSNSSGFFSFVAISWMTGLMWKAYRHGLTEDDLYDLQVGCTSSLMLDLCHFIMFQLFVKIFFPFANSSFSICHNIQTSFGAYPASYPVGTEVLFSGVKQLGHEASHSHPSIAYNVC